MYICLSLPPAVIMKKVMMSMKSWSGSQIIVIIKIVTIKMRESIIEMQTNSTSPIVKRIRVQVFRRWKLNLET